MAELKANTTIGGKIIWNAGNLPLLVKPDTLEYKGSKVYTEASKPTPNEIGAYTSTEVNNLLNTKVDKVANKGLSEKDFSAAYETKLNGIEAGAQKNVATNLVFLTTATDGSLQSTTGNTINIPQANTTKAGLISSSDKVKLDSLPSGNSGIIPLTGGGTGGNTASSARTNLGLGNSSTLNVGTAAGTVAAGNDSRINNGQSAFNRLDIGTTAATARTALQLGDAATRNVGTAAGNVMEVGAFGVGAGITTSTYPSIPSIGASIVHYFNAGVPGPLGVGYSDRTSYLEMNCDSHRTTIVSDGSSLYHSWVYNKAPTTNDFKLLWDSGNLINIGTTADTARTALQLGNASTHNYGTTNNTIMQGNDARVVNAASVTQLNSGLATKAPTTHNHTWSQIIGIPATATRWPTSSEVGLGNVPNTVHTAESVVNTVVVRDGHGDVQVRLLRSEYADELSISGAIAFRVNNTTDNYLRFCSDPNYVRTWIGAAASSHTHSYLPLTGGTVGRLICTGGYGTDYNTGAIEVRSESSGTNPTIGFHHASLYGFSLQTSTAGFLFRDQGNNAYKDITAQNGNFNDVYIRSDIRDKKDIKKIPDALNKLNKISGNTYQVLTSKDNYQNAAGILAQEVIEVLPSIVSMNKNGDDEDRYNVTYAGITALLVEAVKELSTKVLLLEKKLGGN